MSEYNEYILGTDKEELSRLEIQHKVWLSEAKHGWNLAGFKSGQTILDLGCGPGYCTMELAKIVGPEGIVIGVDRSEGFINYLQNIQKSHQLSIEPCLTDFDDLTLEEESLDGMYSRWALAWTPNPKAILKNIQNALKPKGKMVIHEYYNFSTHQTHPEKPALKKAIGAALKSFNESDCEINIGSLIPGYVKELNMKMTHIRLMPKLATPGSMDWEWPKTWYQSYFPRLVEMGYLSTEDMNEAFADLEAIEQKPYTTLCCPMMVEVIAEK